MCIRLQKAWRRASIGALVALVVAAVVLSAVNVTLAGLAPLSAAREERAAGSLQVSAGATAFGAKGPVASGDEPAGYAADSAAGAVEVPEPGVPVLLIGLAIVGVVLAASHRMRADASSQHAFDDWDVNPKLREGAP